MSTEGQPSPTSDQPLKLEAETPRRKREVDDSEGKTTPQRVTGNEVFRWIGAYYLHQDQLSWSRLQTLVAVEAGVLAGGYTVKGPLSICLLLLGSLVVLIVRQIVIKDWAERNYAHERLEEVLKAYNFDPRKHKPGGDGWPGAPTVLCWLLMLCFVLNGGLIVAKLCSAVP